MSKIKIVVNILYLMLPVLWTSQKSDDTDASDSIQTASTDCKFVVFV
jgi:hypothetical protein